MPKIALIGAGGYVFPLRLIQDILAFPELQDSTFALMDIDASRLERTAGTARKLVERHKLPARIDSTTDRRQALDGADYVIITFQVGGLEAYKFDVEIPRAYGVDQTVGDTLGPGGIFRGLRTVAVLQEIATDMHELCPEALLIQYANPMAINSWAMNRLGINNVGLCHSVQGTSKMLAKTLEVPYEEVAFRAAGINHQAWFLEFKRGDEDLLPRIRDVMTREHFGTPKLPREGIYEGPGNDRVRSDIMRLTGYFHTESPHHASEYLPWFRKNPELADYYLPDRWDYYELCAAHDEEGQSEDMLAKSEEGLKPSHEYGAFIIHSIETGTPRVIYGNVDNTELITNLPTGCCVEVPCLVDKNGIQPTHIGALPVAAAAINRTSINVQELSVEAAFSGDPSLVTAAVALDPLTASQCSLGQIREMTTRLFEAEAAWLPQFKQLQPA